MRITIAGGGNIGTQFAVPTAEKGHEVTIFTSNPGLFRERLSIVDKSGNTIHEGNIHLATSDPNRAFRDAEIIIITMPPTMMIPLSELIYKNTVIGFVPGNGGFEFAFRKCIERGNIFFGIDRVPAIARLIERGREVCCSGYKDELYVAAIPSRHTEDCASFMESIFDIPCIRLPGFGLEYVVSERSFYDADTAEEMTHAISTDESLKGLATPSVRAEAAAIKGRGLGGIRTRRRQWSEFIELHMERKSRWRERIEKRWTLYSEKINGSEEEESNRFIPDLHSRYFTADFPYGLSVIQQIGKIAGADIPNINGLMDWYDEIAIVNDKLIISDYGIFDLDTLREFYLQ